MNGWRWASKGTLGRDDRRRRDPTSWIRGPGMLYTLLEAPTPATAAAYANSHLSASHHPQQVSRLLGLGLRVQRNGGKHKLELELPRYVAAPRPRLARLSHPHLGPACHPNMRASQPLLCMPALKARRRRCRDGERKAPHTHHGASNQATLHLSNISTPSTVRART